MAQLHAHKFFIGLTRNTTALQSLTMCMKRHYAKVASPEDYGHYTDPLEAHEESMKRRQLVATLAGDDVSRTQLSQCFLFYMKGNHNVAVAATGLSSLIKKERIISEAILYILFPNFSQEQLVCESRKYTATIVLEFRFLGLCYDVSE